MSKPKYAESILKPFRAMATATAHLPHTETLIARPAPDRQGGRRLIELTVGELRELIEWAEGQRP